MTVNGVVVYTGNYTPVVGMNTFVFSTPIAYTGGDLVVEWCFDNAAYNSWGQYNYFESTMISGTLSNYSDYSVLIVARKLSAQWSPGGHWERWKGYAGNGMGNYLLEPEMAFSRPSS